MAERGARAGDTFFGIGILNEPQPGDPSPSPSDLHNFIASYYHDALLAARKHLSNDVPLVLFSWTYDYRLWGDNSFPSSQYGKVMWNTHSYQFGANSVDESLNKYANDF